MKSTRFALMAAIGAMVYMSAEPGAAGGGSPVPPAPDTKTPEQLAAEKAAADNAAAEKKAADKAAKEQAKVEAKAKRDAEKAEKKAAADAKKAQEAEEKAKKKAEQEAAKAAAKLPEQNGVTRPKPGTITGSVWDAADAISKNKGSPAAVSEVAAALPKVADATVKTQYARWRKFLGVSGRVQSAEDVAKAAAKAKADAEKAAAKQESAPAVPTPPVAAVPTPPAG